ncbi:DNA replication complex subunit Gins51 [Halolamina rubra]|uniref:DNA replication complex subunit Gins51 n=1 Tax=Halolamina rubra TaxID=1380430 RepID=UPI000678D758|nr:hypothetical protein [Halolamina rubra]
MDIDELQTVQSKERQKDSLQHLRDSFYEDVAAYIEELKEERDRVADDTDDPFSDPEVSQLTDDIERAEDVVEAIYERRVGKVVKMASFAAADMPVEEEGLTTQERDLFEDMVGRIGENRSRVLDILAGEGDSVPASSVGAPGAQPEPTESTTEESAEPSADEPAPPSADGSPSRDEPAVGTGTTADAAADTDDAPPAPPDAPPREAEEAPPEEPTDPRSDGGVAASSTADAPERDDDRTTVRVTEDVGRLLGVDDREYELKSDDVVSLPEDNAEALLQREAAEELW